MGGFPQYIRITICAQIKKLLSTPYFGYDDREDIAQDMLCHYLYKFYEIPDVDEANREWFMNTDPAQQRKPDPLFEAQGGVRMSNMGTFQQAKTADIYYRAMLAKAKLKMLTGEMVDRKRAGNYAFNLGRALRDLFMSFPVRYGALIAAELGTDEHQTSAILDEYIRKMLTESQDILSKEL